MTRTLFVIHDDFPGPQSRALLDWCLARGADAFTISVVGAPGEMEAYSDALRARLAPYRIASDTVRGIPESEQGGYWTHPEELWQLTRESAEILWEAVDGDLLTYYPGGAAWCEDPIVYRAGELLLGIISHEREGVLRVERADELSLAEAGIRCREEGRWIGYCGMAAG